MYLRAFSGSGDLSQLSNKKLTLRIFPHSVVPQPSPLDQIADVNLTYTADECKLYVNQFYTSFWGSPNNYIYHIDRGSDNLLSDNYQDNKDLIEGLHQVPSSGEGWGTTEWGKIRSVNFLLDNCDKSPEPPNFRRNCS